MNWKIWLAYITGTVDQELLLRNEYLATENRILRNQIIGRVRLSDGERKALKEECLSRLILFGEASLQHVLYEYIDNYHHERNHQGKGNLLLFPAPSQDRGCEGPIRCHERLGGLLKYYAREAA